MSKKNQIITLTFLYRFYKGTYPFDVRLLLRTCYLSLKFSFYKYQVIFEETFQHEDYWIFTKSFYQTFITFTFFICVLEKVYSKFRTISHQEGAVKWTVLDFAGSEWHQWQCNKTLHFHILTIIVKSYTVCPCQALTT